MGERSTMCVLWYDIVWRGIYTKSTHGYIVNLVFLARLAEWFRRELDLNAKGLEVPIHHLCRPYPGSNL